MLNQHPHHRHADKPPSSPKLSIKKTTVDLTVVFDDTEIHPRYRALSCQKATALAAATFSESTW